MFRSEEQLVKNFVVQSDAFLHSVLREAPEVPFFLHEFDSKFGIADIVIGVRDPKVGRNGPAINQNWVWSLSQLVRGTEIDANTLVEQFLISKGMATRFLREFFKAGFLSRLPDKSFKVEREYEPIAKTIISIEAKLRNWKRAVSQARRYNRFSDMTFVLLDDSNAESALKNLDFFKETNVGLVTAGINSFDVHFVPHVNKKKWSDVVCRVNEAVYATMSAG